MPSTVPSALIMGMPFPTIGFPVCDAVLVVLNMGKKREIEKNVNLAPSCLYERIAQCGFNSHTLPTQGRLLWKNPEVFQIQLPIYGTVSGLSQDHQFRKIQIEFLKVKIH